MPSQYRHEMTADRNFAVLDEAERATHKAQDITGFSATEFLRIRNGSLARCMRDRLMNFRSALDGLIRVTIRTHPWWTVRQRRHTSG